MPTNVVLPFDGDFDALRALLATWDMDVGERPNAPVFAQGHGISIHAYRTGKLMVSGARAEEFAAQLQAKLRGAGTTVPAPKARAARPAPPAARLGAGTAVPAPRGWLLHFDGSCMPRNPGGIAAFGFVVFKDGALVHEGHGVAAPPGPGATNNVAEFAGLIGGLRWLKEHARPGEPVLVRGDSDLVIASLTGRKSIHKAHLLLLRDEAAALVRELGARLEWVPRDSNAGADRMSRVGFTEAARAHPEWLR